MSTGTAVVLPLTSQRTLRADRAPRARVRLEPTRRGRRLLLAVAFALGLLVALVALLVVDLPSALAGTEAGQPVTVTVEAGDTLWGYAEEYAPEGMSPQDFVSEVRSANHLPTGRITAGQEIVLPAAELPAR
ncbi:cell division suppressor protein YneA [Brachybacterium saurashtrense]|uniref:LysM peptidoglycan-binding domain-containing protein n=1 Tax=Brachybacterium saurashtrense TaxID=556288 RepID=A0A345YL17_9MICO|nr:LysM peptidoglycan-binding domain-containing protein [Brachybacterium saurashtrense]AXK44619.1 LysM peptidoglycan-binding domain-containing protein [Brachybacterium saurashtrense]RRR23231.1 LysM peptidoglycan-binding domain-containing protein [Brachybacterium saurashtrense]